MGAEQVSLTLVQLDLSCLNGSGHTPLLCDHGGNFSVHVMVALELSCDSPVFLGPGVVVHCSVHGVICEAFEEPIREFSLFFNGDALWWEELMLVDGFVDANGTQTVQSIQFDVGGEYVHGVVTIGDGDEEVEDVPFVLFIPFRCLSSSLPFCISPVSVFCPVLVGFFQASCIHLMLCQIVTSLFEDLELFLIVTADLLIFSHNSHQSLHNEEEFLPSWCPVSFKSSTH